MSPTRWGISSAGKIANDFVICLKSLDPKEHQIVGVACRRHEAAKEFAIKYEINKTYQHYVDLSKDPEVDVVYICSLNHNHFQMAKVMLEAGKHVLCEKPMCMNLKDTEELIRIARKNKKFLMEGIWSRFFPAYYQLRELLSSKIIGEPNMVQAMFGCPMSSVDRIRERELGGSVTLDVGIYTAQICSLVFKGEKPLKITSSGNLNETEVDDVVHVALDYGQGRTAHFSLSSQCQMYNTAVISGPTQHIRLLPPFHCPTHLETPDKTFEFPLPKTVSDSFNYGNSQGLLYEAQEVRRCLQEGLLESPYMTLDESVVLAYILEEVRRQVGVNFFP